MACQDDRSGTAWVQVDTGEWVIYDRENHQAWLQSDACLSIGTMR